MKISKKLLSVVLSLVMVFSAVAACSVTASADVTFPEYDSTKTSLVIGTPQAKAAGHLHHAGGSCERAQALAGK